MVLYELPKRKSFLLTIVLFSADCKSTTTAREGIRVSRRSFPGNRRETNVFSSNLCQPARSVGDRGAL